MKKKTTVMLCCLLLSLALESRAGGVGAAAFLNLPVGARAISLGGAYISLAADASAVYWNPARLGTVHGFSLNTALLSTHFGDNGSFGGIDMEHMFIAAAAPLGRWGTLGAGWKRFAIPDIERTISEGPGDHIGYFDDQENAFYLSYGIEVVPEKMQAGFTITRVQQDFTVIDNASASGTGVSIGLSYQMLPNLTLALRADDDFAVKWADGVQDQSPFRGIASGALSLFSDHLLVTTDLVQVRDWPLKLHSGMELRLDPAFFQSASGQGINRLALRGGIHNLYLEDRGYDLDFQRNMNLACGLGVGLRLGGLQIELDYALGDSFLGMQNYFSTSFEF